MSSSRKTLENAHLTLDPGARVSYLNDTVSAYNLATGRLPPCPRALAVLSHSGGMKVYVYYVGKARDVHANAIAAEFMKRCTRYAECDMREIVPKRTDLFSRHSSARKIFLDPLGRALDSAQFTEIVRRAENEAQDLVFLIGGHDGLPLEWRPKADLLLSLSPLTFPHELARAVLTEQIYRAFTTLRGHPYPR